MPGVRGKWAGCCDARSQWPDCTCSSGLWQQYRCRCVTGRKVLCVDCAGLHWVSPGDDSLCPGVVKGMLLCVQVLSVTDSQLQSTWSSLLSSFFLFFCLVFDVAGVELSCTTMILIFKMHVDQLWVRMASLHCAGAIADILLIIMFSGCLTSYCLMIKLTHYGCRNWPHTLLTKLRVLVTFLSLCLSLSLTHTHTRAHTCAHAHTQIHTHTHTGSCTLNEVDRESEGRIVLSDHHRKEAVQPVCWPGLQTFIHCIGGRDSSVGVLGLLSCMLRDAALWVWSCSELLVEGIFPLELTWVLTPFPKNSFGWENKLRFSLEHTCIPSHRLKNPDIHVLDGWMLATKTHPACTIHKDGMWLPQWFD